MRGIDNKEYWLKNMPEYPDGEGSINQKIWDIPDRNVRRILQRYFDNKLLKPEEIDREVYEYYQKIERKLSDESDEWDRKIFDTLGVMMYRYFKWKSPITSLYKSLCYEIKEKKVVLQKLSKLNPDMRKLVETSLGRILPSRINEGISIYETLSKVTDPEEKRFISKCFEYWWTPNLVNEAFEDYQCIESYGEGYAKSLAMAYIKKTNQAWDAASYLDLFQTIWKYWEDTVKYILKLIDKSDKVHPIEILADIAYRYNELIKKIIKEYWEDTSKYILKQVDEQDTVYSVEVLDKMAYDYHILNN